AAQLDVKLQPERVTAQKAAVAAAGDRIDAADKLLAERRKQQSFGQVTAAALAASEAEVRQLRQPKPAAEARLAELAAADPGARGGGRAGRGGPPRGRGGSRRRRRSRTACARRRGPASSCGCRRRPARRSPPPGCSRRSSSAPTGRWSCGPNSTRSSSAGSGP